MIARRPRRFGLDSTTAATSIAAATGTAPTTSPAPPAPTAGSTGQTGPHSDGNQRRWGGREDRLWGDLVHRRKDPEDWL